ncbi:hypothetical protein [Francisella hispaniensis]|uniref:Uncharacterized protein n=1 Tax=Francisella hispaniensis FSC454 TaxID=1088883 RepID=A0AAC9NP26_9GAMM|nr:hypothetical protein [Francisella hispaniensis]APD50518.1 hypothetical protein FSC454_04940 [Francisella hispaniensis FSC454]KYW84969.1 hypothetical protein AUF42_05100 [Francisella hispaniensis FSC454]
MKFERLLFLIIFISIYSFCYAYYVKDNGKKIIVSKKVANTIDDIEIQEGESLTQQQIIDIIENSSGSTEEL